MRIVFVFLLLLWGIVSFFIIWKMMHHPSRQISRKDYTRIPQFTGVKALNSTVYYLPGFLSEEECNGLVSLASPRLSRSTVQLEKSQVSRDRTSYTTNLLKAETPLVRIIEERASGVALYPLDHLEPLQVVRYSPGQFFKPHYDYFIPGAKGSTSQLQRGGQRTVTIFVYLNDSDGDTVFPKLNLRVTPRKGAALFWNNVKSDREENSDTLHGGEAPKETVKFGLNIWFRQRPFK
jgi:prolyl 4-hydroxylase